MSLFKQFIIDEKVRNRLSTLRYKFLAIPAYIEEQSDKVVVKMALQINRRAWIRKLWGKSSNFKFSTGQFGIISFCSGFVTLVKTQPSKTYKMSQK